MKRLVEMHGGDISAHSDGASPGSEFIVRLPLATNIKGSSAALVLDVAAPDAG